MLRGRSCVRTGSRYRRRSRSLRPMGWPWRLSLHLEYQRMCPIFPSPLLLQGKDRVPLFQLLDPLHPPLRIRDHLAKQVRKARLAELGRLGPIEGAVVDSLAVAGVP